MSRETYENDKYQFALGVDHALGAFFQIWEKAAKGEDAESDEGDQPQISASEQFGFALNNPKTLGRNVALCRRLDLYKSDVRNLRDPETIVQIGKTLGFTDIHRKVYQLWD